MPQQNAFLNEIGARQLALLGPHLTSVTLSQRTTMLEIGRPSNTVYFPLSGAVALSARLKNGDAIQLAMIGNDGVIGGSSVLSSSDPIYDAVVQLPIEALAIRATRLSALAQQNHALLQAIMHHEHRLLAYIVRSAACGALHSVEKRLARWIFRAYKLTGDQLPMTQAFMSELLSVRRASISIAADKLQGSGAIRYLRGSISITDAKRLKAAACLCCETDGIFETRAT